MLGVVYFKFKLNTMQVKMLLHIMSTNNICALFGMQDSNTLKCSRHLESIDLQYVMNTITYSGAFMKTEL